MRGQTWPPSAIALVKTRPHVYRIPVIRQMRNICLLSYKKWANAVRRGVPWDDSLVLAVVQLGCRSRRC
jgi:hypothetical protein